MLRMPGNIITYSETSSGSFSPYETSCRVSSTASETMLCTDCSGAEDWARRDGAKSRFAVPTGAAEDARVRGIPLFRGLAALLLAVAR